MKRRLSGMFPSESRHFASAGCGGIEQAKHGVWEHRASMWMEVLGQDVHYGLRQLRRSPGFAALVILTLAMGIGANTAIFSFINSVLLRPLPYPDANRLAIIWSGLGYANRAPASSFELLQIRQQTKEFDQVGGIWVTNGSLPGEGDAEQTKVGVVTSNFLPLVCTRPALGRFFGSEDENPNAQQALIISHGVWARRFGSNPAVIGRSVQFGARWAVVVGVLPEKFQLIFPNDSSVPSNVDVFYTIPIDASDPNGPAFLHLIGRLRVGSNLARAQAEADSIARQINLLDGRKSLSNFRLYVFSLHADDVREVSRTLVLLFGGVALVLLIGCANVANLLMVRARQRLRETSIRAALGASRGRIVRQLLTESLLLGCLGAVMALGIGWAAVRAIVAARPPSFVNFSEVNLDLRVLTFTFVVAIFTSVLFGLAPVLAVRRLDLTGNLKEVGLPAGWKRRHWSQLLVSIEIALAFVLLVGTGLLMRTFVNVLRLDPGFRAQNAFAFRISVPNYGLLRQLQQNLAALPGVESVAAVSHLPLDDTGNWYDYYWKEGAPVELQNTVMADLRSILPGYLSTIGASLLKGRDFTESDDIAHQHVVVVDDVLARELWPGGDAIGRKLNISDSPDGPYQFQRDWVVVVGIVRHVQYHSLTAIVRPQVYLPFQLAPRPTMSMVIRTAGAMPNLAGSVRTQVALLNKNLAISHVEPMSRLVARALSETRFASLLATLLSAIGIVLASIGIYGVLSYSVAQRTSEIGIRMAIGAHRLDVIRMVLVDGFVSVLLGLGCGFLLSLVVTPLLARFLFGVKPGSPANYVVILVVVMLVSALAAFLPARRAMNIDPLTALRYE
jgi:predicted permease